MQVLIDIPDEATIILAQVAPGRPVPEACRELLRRLVLEYRHNIIFRRVVNSFKLEKGVL
jgi:hypothetical protein